MQYNSYIVSETKTAFSIPMQTPIIKKNLKQKAFTLAETLITLSIIGVVAAMTVPTLVTNAQKASYVAGLKKAYSNLKNAALLIPIDQGCAAGDYSCATQNTETIDFIAKHFKTAKICNFSTSPDCKFSTVFNPPIVTRISTAFITKDGIAYGMHMDHFVIDVNGEKGPNQWGRDQFYLKTYDSYNAMFAPLDYVAGVHTCLSKPPKETGLYNLNCTAKVLKEGKMDY